VGEGNAVGVAGLKLWQVALFLPQAADVGCFARPPRFPGGEQDASTHGSKRERPRQIDEEGSVSVELIGLVKPLRFAEESEGDQLN